MKVRLMPHQREWVLLFTEESARLRQIFGPALVALEHFGSTAVPGMMAKPVIDIMAIVRTREVPEKWAQLLQSLGYHNAGEWGIAGRRLFRKGGENRSHHLHVYPEGHPEIRRHLVLRDYLLTHPQEVEAYSAVKWELARRYDDTEDYSPAKKPYVRALEQRALSWADKQGAE
ncbi:GrpB family protein [Sulfobacillus sp. DSM 109850]|uniref:GrpB family protein n=1 Tax=Sulfobacillus harzensis TaxID=2729629 RepID=A0A7Y0L632_9FIRM|nr:GrpB family protein [Sulfobacillus harzensis]